jgi:hypothetical protein
MEGKDDGITVGAIRIFSWRAGEKHDIFQSL